MACFGAFLALDNSIAAIWVLTLILGLFMGGCFNMLASLEIIQSTENNSTAIEMLSTLLMAMGNMSVGIANLITGITLSQTEERDFSILFYIEIGLIGLAGILFLIRSVCFTRQPVHNELIEAQEAAPCNPGIGAV